MRDDTVFTNHYIDKNICCTIEQKNKRTKKSNICVFVFANCQLPYFYLSKPGDFFLGKDFFQVAVFVL